MGGCVQAGYQAQEQVSSNGQALPGSCFPCCMEYFYSSQDALQAGILEGLQIWDSEVDTIGAESCEV